MRRSLVAGTASAGLSALAAPGGRPMAERLAAGDAVRLGALRGTVLPDPLGKREPEYYL